MEGGLASLHRCRAVTPIPSAAGPPPGSEEPPSPPEFSATTRPWPGLDRLGLTQAIGGLALGLIALFSSYDHITFAGRVFTIPQQWGIPLIAASVAIVFVDAELETRARDRRAYEADRAADEAKRAANEADRRENEADRERNRADRERNRADQERNRADQERNRAAEARERQAETAERQNAALDLLRRSALLSARVQLDPSDTNRARLQTFLSLMTQATSEDPDL